MKKLRRLLIFLILASSTCAGWIYRAPLLSLFERHFTTKTTTEEGPRPDPEHYQELIAQLENTRADLAARYARARTAQEISDIVNLSQRILEEQLPEMMRCWLGTPWDLNGTCQTPGSGKIACGYFISTILRDAGFKVERFRLAQQPSQLIIGTFMPRKKMHISAGLAYDDFINQVKARRPGIHIVGLDQHVAFLTVSESREIRFLHASGSHPYCVVDEDRENAGALQRSNYRVIGNFSRNPEIIHGWLTGQKWPTKVPAGT